MEAAMYIEHTWHSIEEGMRAKGFSDTDLSNMRIVFAGGLRAATAAALKHQASAMDISTAADWIDGQGA